MHIYSFFCIFLSFPLNIFVRFIFIALFPNCHLALVLFSSLCFNSFCSSRYNFWFPLFTRSFYCTLFLLDCFDFAYWYICVCVYPVTLSIVVIDLCLYIGLLQFCGVFPFLFFNFNFLNLVLFFLYLFLSLLFLWFFSPCS